MSSIDSLNCDAAVTRVKVALNNVKAFVQNWMSMLCYIFQIA